MWHIIKKYLHELERVNNMKLADSAWQRFKRMEDELRAWAREEYTPPVLTPQCSNCFGTGKTAQYDNEEPTDRCPICNGTGRKAAQPPAGDER